MTYYTTPRTQRPAHSAGFQPRFNAPHQLGLVHAVPADLIGIIGFADQAQAVLPLVEVIAPLALSAPAHLKAGGVTNLTASLRLAKMWLTGLDRHILRKVVIIGDGEPNEEVGGLIPLISQMRDNYISIDTIYCGSEGGQGQQTLANISTATVGGKANTASSVEALKDLVSRGATRLHKRQAATVILVDCSSSMNEAMPGGTTRIAAAIAACQAVVLIKRVAFGQVQGTQTSRAWEGAV